MATEPSNLRHLFGETPTPAIDVSTVIRRSRARRAPRVLGAGAFAVLAVGAIAYGGFSGIAGFGGATASDAGGAEPMAESMQSAEDASDGSGDAQTLYGEEKSSVSVGELFRCGEAVLEIPASELGVVLSLSVPTVVDAGAASIPVSVSVVNESAGRVEARVSATPAVAVLSGGVVVAIAEAGLPTTTVDLGPGESFAYEPGKVPLSCDGQPVQPGTYEVQAAVDTSAVSGRPWATGPTQRVLIQ